MSNRRYEQALDVFSKLSERPHGYKTFFENVSDDVTWVVTGRHIFSGTWTTKKDFYCQVWMPIVHLLDDSGPKLDIISDIILGSSGWIVVELKTSDTRTRLGGIEYLQHYAWHCQFDKRGLITQVRAFLDSSTAEKVLEEEKRIQCQAVSKSIPDSTSYPQYPEIFLDDNYKSFIYDLYTLADKPDAHDEYTNLFTANATLVVGERKAVGHAEILELRKAAWENISRRIHLPKKVFPFGNKSDSVMIYGDVRYEFNDGKTMCMDWAGRFHIVKANGGLKLDFYQVFLERRV